MATRLYAQKTRVPEQQSRMEIERLLERHKAKQFSTGIDYEQGRGRVQFKLHERIVRFSVEMPTGEREKDLQARRQKWRALLLVIKAKLESFENQIATFEEEFLAHIVLPNDQTVGEAIVPHVNQIYKTGRMPKMLMSGDLDD